MAIITYGKSLNLSATARARRHARRRAAAIEREKLENIIDAAFGVHAHSTPVEDKRSVRIIKAITTETEYSKQINAEAAKYHIPDMPAGSVCLPQVALYAAGFRKARKGAVHFVK